MSKTLIIFSHPNKEGHAGYTLKKVTEELGARGAEFHVLDLYEIGFDPVLKKEEHYASGHNKVSEETIAIQKQISEADNLVFIFPIWWQNVPAILKGFFDKVLLPKFAFEYEGKLPVGLLKGKKGVVFSTSGAPRFYTRFLARDRAMKIVITNTLKFCGIKLKGFSTGSANRLTEKNKLNIDKNIKKALKFFSL